MTELFLKIINMSITASWIVLAVLVLRPVLKKAPKWINVLLWGIVAVRLLCPFYIESILSLVPSAETISPEIMTEAAPAIHTGISVINNALNPAIGQHLAPEPGASANPLQIWIPILTVIWIIGIAALLAYTAISCQRLRKKVGTAVILRDNIFQSENVSNPFVFGIIKPKIYLPFKMDDQNLEHVVAHEQAHIRRGDHLWKPLGFLLLVIHWFNPLMWLAYLLFCRDIELACDEKVIKELGKEQRADYSQALLACSVNRRVIAACPLAFGEVGVKERVKSVINYRKPAFWLVAAAIIACVVAAVCFLTNPKQTGFPAESENGAFSTSGGTIMKPTSADIHGVFDIYLYVHLNGETYRYEQIDMDNDNITPGKLLDRFTEKATPQNIDWEIYSIKECPDYSVVFAVAGEDYEHVYRYSPSKRSDPNALQQAKENGYVIIEDGDVTFGQQVWLDFIKAAEEGKKASVQVAHYHTLDPERCTEQYYEAHQEDYPALYVLDLSFNGNSYTLRWNEGSTEYVREYQYLMHYTGEESAASATFDSYTRYVLTNDNTVTWEDILQGMSSSQYGDNICHFSIYTDLN